MLVHNNYAKSLKYDQCHLFEFQNHLPSKIDTHYNALNCHKLFLNGKNYIHGFLIGGYFTFF